MNCLASFKLRIAQIHKLLYSATAMKIPQCASRLSTSCQRRPNTWRSLNFDSVPRWYPARPAKTGRHDVFDGRQKWLQKQRAGADVERSQEADYLKDEVATRLCERLLYIKRDFPRVLDVGANTCNIARALARPISDPDLAASHPLPIATRIGELVAVEMSEAQLCRDKKLDSSSQLKLTRQVLDDAEQLPFAENSFDMVLSSMSLHWINDLPGMLAQINKVLKPDCPFLGAMVGGDSLYELRGSLLLAEQERRGGMGMHVSPLADVKDIGGLLQRAGFNMLTVDVDDIIIEYPDTFALMQDLQAMGESNATVSREMGAIKKDVLLANEAIYRAMYGDERHIPATFRIIYMIGWKWSPDQPKPMARGTGEINLRDVLGKAP